MKSKVCVITGASKGIGAACASRFIENGWKVYNLCRSGKGAEGTASIVCDVTDDESVNNAFDKVYSTEGRIDVVIANAGYGISGAAELCGTEKAQNQFDVNFFGVLRTFKAAAPLLRGSKGRFLAVSSAAALFPIPFQSFYSASKSAVNTFVFAAANEIKRFGVQAGVVQLGDVKTSFTAMREKDGAGSELYCGAIEKSVAVMERDEQNGMQPEKVAKRIYSLLNKRRLPLKTTVGLKYKLLVFLSHVLPTGLQNRIIAALYIK